MSVCIFSAAVLYRFILTASVCAIVAQLDRAFILLSEENKKSEPFSYREKVRIFIVWCDGRDSNPRPTDS